MTDPLAQVEPMVAADRIMQEFYLSPAYDPKAARPADTVKAAIAFTLARIVSGSGVEEPPTWPEWAEALVEILREYNGEIGDDEGIDLPEELREWIEGYATEIGYEKPALRTASPVVAEGGGVSAIADERRRQVEQEGWTPEHDDEHGWGQLAVAAACYALAQAAHWAAGPAIDQFWPWDIAHWKPKDARSNLVRAGALLAAEIDRLDRARPGAQP